MKQLFRAPSPRQALFIGTALAAFFLFGCKSADNYTRASFRKNLVEVSKSVDRNCNGGKFNPDKMKKAELSWSALADSYPEAAIAEMTRAIHFGTRGDLTALAYTCRAAAYERTGQFEKAAADYEKAFSLGSNYWETYEGYAMFLGLRDTVDHAKLAEVYAKWQEKMPFYSNKFLARGVDYFETGRYNQAIRDLTLHLHLVWGDKSRMSYPLEWRAKAWYAIKNYERALEDCNALIAISPQTDYYYLRGKIYFAWDRHEEAIADYANGKGYYNRGYYDGSHDSTGRQPYAIAVEYYSKRLETYPDSLSLRYKRWRMCLKAEEFGKADSDFAVLLAGGWDARELYALHAQTFEWGRDYSLAVKDYSKLISLEPGNFEWYEKRARANENAGNYLEAANDYTRLLRFEPGNAKWHERRAAAFEKGGNYAGAVADYSMLIRLEPDEVKWLTKRAQANKTLGNYEQALNDYRAALPRKSYPDQGYYLIDMSFIRKQMGDCEGAIAELSEAIKRARKDEPGKPEEYEMRMVPWVRAHMYRAWIHKENGDTTAALADYMEMVDMAKNRLYGDWFFLIAQDGFPGALEILIDRKEYARALELLDDYQWLQPIGKSLDRTSPWALYQKGYIYFKMGDLERANKYYKEAVKHWSWYADKPYQ